MWLRSATVRNVKRALKEVNAFEYEGDYRPATRQALKDILQESYSHEVDEYLGRGRYERRSEEAVKDYRNGTQRRRFLTELGEVELRLSRTRRRFVSRVLHSYARRAEHIDRLILACFVLGMSTRKVAEALLPLLGRKISPQLVSDIAKQLDVHVARYHARRLEDRYRFLFFDGVTLTHKGAAKVQKRIILCAYGITHDDKHEMIDFLVASSESQGAWEGFLHQLYQRGLVGEAVRLIVTDGCPGLMGALEIVYARIPRQHCWAHKARNVLDKIPKRQHAAVKKELTRISHAPNRLEATRAFWSFCQKYRDSHPRAVASLERHIEELLVFFQIKLHPDELRKLSAEQRQQAQLKLWKQLRTTNLIERAFREVRRRTRAMGVFNNLQSMERILFAVFHHLNNQEENKPLFEFTQNA